MRDIVCGLLARNVFALGIRQPAGKCSRFAVQGESGQSCSLLQCLTECAKLSGLGFYLWESFWLEIQFLSRVEGYSVSFFLRNLG